jgi:hypothetical protein
VKQAVRKEVARNASHDPTVRPRVKPSALRV